MSAPLEWPELKRKIRMEDFDIRTMPKRLEKKGVQLSAPQGDRFLVGVNETLNRTTPAELTDAFVRGLTA